MKQFIVVSFLAAIFFFSCSKESDTYIPAKPDGCTDGPFFYTKDIKPIIAINCTGPTCHIAGTTNVNYDFSSYEVLADRIRNDKVIYRLLLPVDDPQHMPQTGPPHPVGYNLNPCDLYKVITWINEGYPNN